MKQAKSTLTFHVYRARDGWRWRITGRNNRIMADSAEAYTRKYDCVRAIDRIRKADLVLHKMDISELW